MQNEKFINYYIELLVNNINDFMQKNMALQTHHRINNEIIQEQKEKIENIEKDIVGLTLENKNLSYKLLDFENLKNEFNQAQNALLHMETFRNELIKSRQELIDTKLQYEEKITLLQNQIPKTTLTQTEPYAFTQEFLQEKIKKKKPLKDGSNF